MARWSINQHARVKGLQNDRLYRASKYFGYFLRHGASKMKDTPVDSAGWYPLDWVCKRVHFGGYNDNLWEFLHDLCACSHKVRYELDHIRDSAGNPVDRRSFRIRAISGHSGLDEVLDPVALEWTRVDEDWVRDNVAPYEWIFHYCNKEGLDNIPTGGIRVPREPGHERDHVHATSRLPFGPYAQGVARERDPDATLSQALQMVRLA